MAEAMRARPLQSFWLGVRAPASPCACPAGDKQGRGAQGWVVGLG